MVYTYIYMPTVSVFELLKVNYHLFLLSSFVLSFHRDDKIKSKCVVYIYLYIYLLKIYSIKRTPSIRESYIALYLYMSRVRTSTYFFSNVFLFFFFFFRYDIDLFCWSVATHIVFLIFFSPFWKKKSERRRLRAIGERYISNKTCTHFWRKGGKKNRTNF
jgi:hypothetical protein